MRDGYEELDFAGMTLCLTLRNGVCLGISLFLQNPLPNGYFTSTYVGDAEVVH